jgi:hypothetical protein
MSRMDWCSRAGSRVLLHTGIPTYGVGRPVKRCDPPNQPLRGGVRQLLPQSCTASTRTNVVALALKLLLCIDYVAESKKANLQI